MIAKSHKKCGMKAVKPKSTHPIRLDIIPIKAPLGLFMTLLLWIKYQTLSNNSKKNKNDKKLKIRFIIFNESGVTISKLREF
ncbi:MAG: hypothetical protein ACQERB_12120 [Promethearchaeati archaeon]